MKITENPFRNFVVSEYKFKEIDGAYLFFVKMEHVVLPITFGGELQIPITTKKIETDKDQFDLTCVLFTNLINGLFDTLIYKNDEFGYSEKHQEWYIYDEQNEKIYSSEYIPEESNDLI